MWNCYILFYTKIKEYQEYKHLLESFRLCKIDVFRQQVRFVTVCMENSILHLLHRRHSAVDTMNISLEQLGQRFGMEVLQGLGGLN